MPNLEQIISFREEYGIGRQKITDSFDSKLLKQYIQAERLRELHALENNGRLDERVVTFSADINNKPEIVKYYERQAKAWVSLLFFDITDFSTLTQNMSPGEITSFLDSYYKKLIPIIYQNGGEIEKTMGDGIICLFGAPFLTGTQTEILKKAEDCARCALHQFQNENYKIKVAFHCGEIMYYKTPTKHYKEYTMIGKAITELYRLESVSMDNSINFFKYSMYGRLVEDMPLGITIVDRTKWEKGEKVENKKNLKGSSFWTVKYFNRK